jgi:hypothetical protein
VSNSSPRGVATVAGVDIGSGKTVTVDLTHDVVVRLTRLPRHAANARYVRLAFSVLGVELPISRSALLRPTSDGGFVTRVDAQRLRFLISGKTQGQLRYLDINKRELRADDFAFNSDRPFLLTANGMLAIILIAFVLSYGWSIAHPLRRGRNSRAAIAVMAVVGAVFGAGVCSLGWAVFDPEPTVATVVAAMVLGAIGITALARATLVNGRRRRLALAHARRDATPDED